MSEIPLYSQAGILGVLYTEVFRALQVSDAIEEARQRARDRDDDRARRRALV